MEAGPKVEVRPTILVSGPALACAARAIRAVIDSVVLGLMTLITHELLRAGSAIPSSMSCRAYLVAHARARAAMHLNKFPGEGRVRPRPRPRPRLRPRRKSLKTGFAVGRERADVNKRGLDAIGRGHHSLVVPREVSLHAVARCNWFHCCRRGPGGRGNCGRAAAADRSDPVFARTLQRARWKALHAVFLQRVQPRAVQSPKRLS